MRRIIIALTAVALLVGASAAYAAFNSYGANLAFSKGSGSPTHPVPVSMVQTLSASPVAPNVRAAPLIDIKTTMYGLKSNAKAFPKCTDTNRMSALHSDSFCPPRALVASGPVHSFLGPPTLTQAGSPCNPFLHVWNGGPGKLWFFFTTNPSHTCLTLHTGDTPAYPGFVRQQGKNLIVDVPLPKSVSTQVAGNPKLYGSLIKEVLTWRKGYQVSIGCKAGKRPYTTSFTAVSSGVKETKSVTHSAKC